MPIQPMSITGKYDQIPDDDDVTPLSSSSTSGRQSKSFRFWAVVVFLLIIISIVSYLAFSIAKISVKNVDIYQTSMKMESFRLTQMSPSHLSSIGLDVKNIAFGNSECKNIKEDCSITKLPLSSLHIDSSKKYQSIIGFGGAFTEATAINFNTLPVDVQRLVIDKYFGKDGIGLSLGRIHINSCDFSPDSYSFDDIPDDFDLEYFDKEVTHDNAFIIPLILYAMELAEDAGRPLRILVLEFQIILLNL